MQSTIAADERDSKSELALSTSLLPEVSAHSDRAAMLGSSIGPRTNFEWPLKLDNDADDESFYLETGQSEQSNPAPASGYKLAMPFYDRRSVLTVASGPSLQKRWVQKFQTRSPLYFKLLLFAGIATPPRKSSIWWLCYFGFRVSGTLGLAAIVVMILQYSNVRGPCALYDHRFFDMFQVFLVFLPLLLANATAMHAYTWIPGKFSRVSKDLEESDANCFEGSNSSLFASPTDSYLSAPTRPNAPKARTSRPIGPSRATVVLKNEGHLAKVVARNFVVILLPLGFIGAVLAAVTFHDKGSDDDACKTFEKSANSGVKLAEQIKLFLGIFFVCSCTVPVLGAVLLALSMDVSLSLKEVRIVNEAARQKTLTRELYVRARDNIADRSEESALNMGLLAVTSLYSTLGLWGYMYASRWESAYHSELNMLAVLALGKEVVLLFTLAFQVMSVNDEADEIIGHLISAPWGEPNSLEEYHRHELIVLATTSARHPDSVKSLYKYFMSPDIGPISFNLCGVRLTKLVVVVGLIVFVLSFVEFTVHQEVHNFFTHDNEEH